FGGPLPDYRLKMLVPFQGSARLEQQPTQLVSQVVERRPQREGRFVLRDGFVQSSRLEIRLAKRGVLIGELRGHVSGQSGAALGADLLGAAQHRVRFLLAAE